MGILILTPVIIGLSLLYGHFFKSKTDFSFAITYFFFTLSCLFVAPIIDKISAKWGMVLRFSAYIAFQYGFIHMNTYYVYITSASLGVGGACKYESGGLRKCSETFSHMGWPGKISDGKLHK